MSIQINRNIRDYLNFKLIFNNINYIIINFSSYNNFFVKTMKGLWYND